MRHALAWGHKYPLTAAFAFSAAFAWVGLMSGWGFSGRDTDYAAHIVIIHRLLQLDFWPLPYSGMVLSHALVAAIVEAAGVSITAAMAFLQAVCLSLIVISLIAIARRTAVSRGSFVSAVVCILAFSVPMLSGVIFRGYFAQFVSMTFYSLSIWLYLEGRIRSAWAFLVAGLLCYPDQWIWLAPLLLLASGDLLGRAQRRLLGVAVIGSSIMLVAAQFRLLSYEGGAHYTWISTWFYPISMSLVVGGLFGLWEGSWRDFWKLRQPKNHWKIVAVIFAVLTITQVLVSYYQIGHVTYYPRKNFYG